MPWRSPRTLPPLWTTPTHPTPAPTRVRVSIPPNVDAAIRKALEKLPADRFTSAQGFSKALSDSGFRHREVLRVDGMLGRPGGLGRLVSKSKVFRGRCEDVARPSALRVLCLALKLGGLGG